MLVCSLSFVDMQDLTPPVSPNRDAGDCVSASVTDENNATGSAVDDKAAEGVNDDDED